MNETSMLLAVCEAKRFIRAADLATKRHKSDDMTFISGCKENGAVKRASLDLTRALAEMRKSS